MVVFNEIRLIAGSAQLSIADKIISAIVVCEYKTMNKIEENYAIKKATFPYIPGFLSYRESPVIIEAFNKLENKPDILLVKGNGILHQRRMGMASYLGILLDTPTIGIAKNLLLGELKDDKVFVDNEERGFVLKTKEHSKPIYISPGHKISLDTAIKIVKNCIKFPHKMPEPLYLAYRYSKKIRESLL